MDVITLSNITIPSVMFAFIAEINTVILQRGFAFEIHVTGASVTAAWPL